MNCRKITDYWNKRGETYSRSWISVAKKRLNTIETDLVKQTFQKAAHNLITKTIKSLDIGIGLGRISDAILSYNIEHYGIDISPVMIDYCRKKYRNNKRVKQLSVNDILKPLPKSWGKFDFVTAIRVLSYSKQQLKELRQILRVMNKGGILIFTVPNLYSSALIPKLWYKHSRLGHEISYNELKKILEKAGFSKYRIEGYTRLLDTFYDWSNDRISADILLATEKILHYIFGPTLFVRLFYVVCTK